MDYTRQIDALQARHRLAADTVTRETMALAECNQSTEAALEAQRVAQAIAQTIQQQAHARIAGVVTRCLAAVFGDNAYEFNILFEQKRGKTEAVLVFVRDGITVDPLTASGGGVVDVAAFALRLAALVLSRPPLRRVLVLDEPFRFVSKEYRDKIRGLLSVLGAEMGVQFVIVTHFEDLRMGAVVEVGQ